MAVADNYKTFDVAATRWTKGITLIEASAGTGKTYAIGMLVLRALVEEEMPLEKIVIVTFTKAATAELKARIRSRLVEARDIFAGKNRDQSEHTDPTLLAWVATVRDPTAAGRLLQLALYDIDRAAIFTIHGFCQRMLAEYALESDELFDVELVENIEKIKQDASEDFWRRKIYTLTPLPCSLITGRFNTPKQLLDSVALGVGRNKVIEPEVGPLEDVISRLRQLREDIGLWWSRHGKELRGYFQKGIDAGHFKKNLAGDFEGWFCGLERFFLGQCETMAANITWLDRHALAGELNGQKIRGERKKQEYLADWPLPEDLTGTLMRTIDELVLTIRVELALFLKGEVSLRLARQGAIGFDDLILRLSEALQGDKGQWLKDILGDRYRVALIDEFQDTDSCQWHIFSTLFGDDQHSLFLIGDPKQAIYKFRGADIHSYFQARKQAGRLLTLDSNYRSHPFLVEEVNRLFGERDEPFYYQNSVLDYRKVRAAQSEADLDLLSSERSRAGMTYCLLEPATDNKDGRWSSGKAEVEFITYTVAEIADLLKPSRTVVIRERQRRALAPSDIAILVRSNRQAELYRQALAGARIPAVVGSNQSIFKTGECRELYLLLQAVESPSDGVPLKSALAITWFGLTGDELEQRWQDERWLSELHGRFLGYNQLWQERGILVMMAGLLKEEELLLHIARGQLAERVISNIFQLLELLQEQENAENYGVAELLLWLKKMMLEDRSGRNAELQLESDEEAVQIVTMHSAKGLEYPVVFCPYLWYGSSRVSSEKFQLSFHDKDGGLRIDLGSKLFEKRREAAADEEMAEELRLLYVALTRAKIRCYVYWADVKGHATVKDSFHSGLGYLLFPKGVVDAKSQQQMFSHLAALSSVQVVPFGPGRESGQYENHERVQSLGCLPKTDRSLETHYQLTSFSALASLSDYDFEGVAEQPDAGSSDDSPQIPLTGLPAGAHFGNVIHDLLEECPFEKLAGSGGDELSQLLLQKCRSYGVEADHEEIRKLLRLVVTTPLLESESVHFRLSTLSPSSCLKEMGFYFSLSRLATDKINRILADETTFTPLHFKEMRGYLTGFVDLFFFFQGKYYLLDYKTNLLGERMGDYHPEKLVVAMQSHNYGLQYWIYTLVLHRHLENLVPGYRYQDHFGGVLYLFVRGMEPGSKGNGIYAALPDHHKLMELDRAIGGKSNA